MSVSRWTKAKMEKRLSKHEKDAVTISDENWLLFIAAHLDECAEQDRKTIIWDDCEMKCWEAYYMWRIGYVPDFTMRIIDPQTGENWIIRR